MSGTKANRIGLPLVQLASPRGTLGPQKEEGHGPATFTHPQTQCCHMGIRGQENPVKIEPS